MKMSLIYSRCGSLYILVVFSLYGVVSNQVFWSFPISLGLTNARCFLFCLLLLLWGEGGEGGGGGG